MVKSNANLNECEKINRQTALLSVGKSKIVARIKDRGKYELYEISTMQELQEVVSREQNRFYCEELKFYREK